MAHLDSVAGAVQELQRHQPANAGLVNLLVAALIAINQGFEAPDARTVQPAPHGAATSLLLLPVQQRAHPGLYAAYIPVGQHPMLLQRLGAEFECGRISC